MARVKVNIQNENGEKETIELTDKQKLFVECYVKFEFNGSKAAREAGYSPNADKEIASDLLTKTNIQKYLNHYRKEIYKRNLITVDEIISNLSDIVRTDPTEIYNENGSLLPISEMSPRARKSIAAMELEELKMPDGKSTITKRKIKLESKQQSYEKLLKILGGYEKDNQQKAAKVEFYLPSNERE